jgi:hypothetical protein
MSRKQAIPEDYVRLERKLCPVCGQQFDSGAILLHKRLRSIPKEAALTGYEFCKECTAKRDEGYVAMVEIDPARSGGGSTKKMEDAYRTGRLLHIRREAAAKIFKDFDTTLDMVWIDAEVFDMLVSMMPPVEENVSEGA